MCLMRQLYIYCFVMISSEITSSGQWMGGVTSDVGKQTAVALSELKSTGWFTQYLLLL